LVANNYIHRDIKPANSLIKDGIHKIADFGFAVKVDVKRERKLKEQVGK
jgi:serine/threonine protein kinase